MSARDWHDRYWAGKCIQVLRAGMKESVERGPGLYLLLDAATLLVFDPKSLTERMRWLKPKSVRLRLVDHEEGNYQEQVASGPEDRFVAIRRVYRPKARTVCRAWLTGNVDLAIKWTQASSFDAANRMMKDAHAPGETLPWRAAGVVAEDQVEIERFQRFMLRHWTDPRRTIDTVYCHEPGVWVHESVSVPAGVRFVPPVWIGAGVKLSPGQVIVGPCAFHDAQPVDRLPPHTDWRGVAAIPPLIRDPKEWARMSRPGKRLFDIAFSLVALAGTLPLYPFIMAAIAIEDGRPFFFAHRRQTLGGREFPCLKFRTMVKSAEKIKQQLVSGNVCDGPQFYMKDDPRVTKVGRILRKFHLDELPQFWNVLAGHMSVVGPRPSPDRENQFCPAWREARLSVRPGVTGLWQVRRTRIAGTDFQEWVRYDLEYVQRQSFALDVRIIVDTIRQIFAR